MIHMPVTQALVLAGGEGTRLRPLTNDVPKPLVPVNGKPLLEWNVRLLVAQGVEEVLLAIGYKAEKIMDYFDDGSRFGVSVDYVIEQEPLGTAGAVKLAEEKLDDVFFCMNADEITNVDLQKMAEFRASRGGIAALYLHEAKDVSGLGVVKTDGDRISAFVEKPDPANPPSRLISGGRYVFDKKIVNFIAIGKQSLERDVFPKLAEKGSLLGYADKNAYWSTINSLDQLKKVEKDFAEGRLKWLEKSAR